MIQDVCRLVRGISSRENSSLTAYIFNLQHFSLIYSLVFKVLLVLLQPPYCTLTSKSYFLSWVLLLSLSRVTFSFSRVLPSLSLGCYLLSLSGVTFSLSRVLPSLSLGCYLLFLSGVTFSFSRVLPSLSLGCYLLSLSLGSQYASFHSILKNLITFKHLK